MKPAAALLRAAVRTVIDCVFKINNKHALFGFIFCYHTFYDLTYMYLQ